MSDSQEQSAVKLLVLRGVTKSYPAGAEVLEVLRGVDLEIRPGTSVAVTGVSGSGKSTLLNVVGGLDRPSAGSITMEAVELTGLDEQSLAVRRRTLGLVFQFHHLLRDFTVEENVLLPAHLQGRPAADAAAEARSLLASVDMARHARRYPSDLSGGEQQRVAVARALAARPSLVLADEPTGNLDRDNSRMIADLLFELVATRGAALLLVTHDDKLAERADRVLTLADGVLRQPEDT